ncbi:MAG: hypothetical protein IJ590_00345 [Rickettsiales bacterium]|nr:hypothetical protein [Rickettsiales bacterium]
MALEFLRKRTAQQKRLFVVGLGIAISILFFVLIQLLSVARVMLQEKQLSSIREKISSLNLSYKKMDGAISTINSAKTSDNLDPKVVKFYSDINKQELVNNVVAKMKKNNYGVELPNGAVRMSALNEYANFAMTLGPSSDINVIKDISSFTGSIQGIEGQNEKATVDGGLLKVSFSADYEYVVYKIIATLDSIFPGKLVVRNISIKPANDDVKTILYDFRFKGKSKNTWIDNRLVCNIELEWMYLKK